jgi:hypothetical protein
MPIPPSTPVAPIKDMGGLGLGGMAGMPGGMSDDIIRKIQLQGLIDSLNGSGSGGLGFG